MTYFYPLERYGLKPDFRPKFPFWGGLGRIRALPQWARSLSLNSLVYQRVLGRCFSNFLEDSAPALPVIFRSFSAQWSLSHWLGCVSVLAVTVECDENRWPINRRLGALSPAARSEVERCWLFLRSPFGSRSGQAFSKGARRGAPPAREKKPAKYSLERLFHIWNTMI
jgi:hypothetical protein